MNYENQKVLTKEIAEAAINSKSNLSHYTRIEDAAAECLTIYDRGWRLDLSG